MSILAERIRSNFIRYGVQRVNRFRVTLPLPQKVNQLFDDTASDQGLLPVELKKAIQIGSILGGVNSQGDRSIQFMCRSAEVPGFQTSSIRGEWQGHSFKIATGLEQSSINFSFQLSGDANEKKIFDSWKKLIVDEETRLVGYPDDYSVDIQIEMLDLRDNPVYEIWLVDAWPQTVQSIGLNRLASDMANSLETSFTYTRLSDYKPTKQNSVSGIPGSLGEVIDGIANGDLEAAAYAARKLIVQAQSGDFSGEAGAVFAKIDEIVRNTTGISATEMGKVQANLETMVSKATGVGAQDKNRLLDLISKL